jgi:hypothetical protein
MSQADVTPLYRVLKETREKTGSDKVVLLVHARGGDAYLPKQLIRLIRSIFREYVALVPHRAHSAATHLALGADRMLLTRLSELTPSGGGARPERSDILALEAYEAARRSADPAAPDLLVRVVEKLGADQFASLLGLHEAMRRLTREILAPRFADAARLDHAVSSLTDRSHFWRLGLDDLRAIGVSFAEPCSPELEVASLSLVHAYSAAFGQGDPVDGLEALNFTGEERTPSPSSMPGADRSHTVLIPGATAPSPSHHFEKQPEKEAPEPPDLDPPDERPSPRPLQARMLRSGYVESRFRGYVHVHPADVQAPWVWVDRLDFDPPG